MRLILGIEDPAGYQIWARNDIYLGDDGVRLTLDVWDEGGVVFEFESRATAVQVLGHLLEAASGCRVADRDGPETLHVRVGAYGDDDA